MIQFKAVLIFLCCSRGPEYSIFVGDLSPDVTDHALKVGVQLKISIVRCCSIHVFLGEAFGGTLVV